MKMVWKQGVEMNLIEDLAQIGLTLNESKVYLSLLKGEQFSAAQLAKESKINRTKIYCVLGNLMKRGFCEEVPGRVRMFRAMDPKIAMNKLISLHENNLKTAVRVTEILARSFQT